MYDHFGSKWSIAEQILADQQERVEAIASHTAAMLPSAFERLLCFSLDLAELVTRDVGIRASMQLSTEPSLPMDAPVWRHWADLADDLVATATDQLALHPGTQRMGRLTVNLVVSCWLMNREDCGAEFDALLAQMWRALALGVIPSDRRQSAQATLEAMFGR